MPPLAVPSCPGRDRCGAAEARGDQRAVRERAKCAGDTTGGCEGTGLEGKSWDVLWVEASKGISDDALSKQRNELTESRNYYCCVPVIGPQSCNRLYAIKRCM